MKPVVTATPVCHRSQLAIPTVARRLLVVENDAGAVADLLGYFVARGYSIDVARDGRTGLHFALNESYDVIVVGWSLPHLEGTQLLRRLRDSGAAVPALMLTARHELRDKLAAFHAGADDYVTRPFALAELEVRFDALVARANGRKRTLEVRDLHFNLTTREVTRAGEALQLRSAPKKLLELLMRHSPTAVTRRRLEAVLWGDDPPDADVLRTHIYDLRRSVDSPYDVKLVETLPKVGYRIRDPHSDVRSPASLASGADNQSSSRS
jgi:DNA-binding response OmpR family regulator